MLLVDRYLMHNPDITILVVTVVSLTILVEVIAAKIVGCILPIAAKRLGLDPAVMASPFYYHYCRCSLASHILPAGSGDFAYLKARSLTL